jgi:bla regulator protein blaR1
MMNKTTTTARILWTQLVILIVVAAAIFVFSDVSIAQTTTKTTPKTSSPKTTSAQKGISEEEREEYDAIIKKYLSRKGNNIYMQPISEKDNQRLVKLYLAMNETQQASVEYAMFPAPPPLPRVTPTEAEFESYKNAKIYGVWVDGKKVPNTALNNYKAADFHQVFVSKLYPNAQKTIGYKYKFQLDLETKDYYEKGRKEALADKKYYLVPNFKRTPKST